MDNILLNVWIEIKNGMKVRLKTKGLDASEQNKLLIMEVNEGENIRIIKLIVKGRKVFNINGKTLDFGDAYPLATEYGKMMITKQFVNEWLE